MPAKRSKIKVIKKVTNKSLLSKNSRKKSKSTLSRKPNKPSSKKVSPEYKVSIVAQNAELTFNQYSEHCRKLIQRKFKGEDRLSKLLIMMKERRGIPPTHRLFTGIADLADQHWCLTQGQLSSKKTELGYMSQYLTRRLKCAHESGIISKLPKTIEELLEIIKIPTYEHMYNQKLPYILKQYSPIPSEKKDQLLSELKSIQDRGWRGLQAQLACAEPYASFMWFFEWDKRFIVCGEPDGITEDFVYEFKHTSKSGYVSDTIERAKIQADLYGYFFEKNRKRVQVYCVESNQTSTFDGPVDTTVAIKYLTYFSEVESEIANDKWPFQPKLTFKCKSCEFKNDCPSRSKGMHLTLF